MRVLLLVGVWSGLRRFQLGQAGVHDILVKPFERVCLGDDALLVERFLYFLLRLSRHALKVGVSQLVNPLDLFDLFGLIFRQVLQLASTRRGHQIVDVFQHIPVFDGSQLAGILAERALERGIDLVWRLGVKGAAYEVCQCFVGLALEDGLNKPLRGCAYAEVADRYVHGGGLLDLLHAHRSRVSNPFVASGQQVTGSAVAKSFS